MTDTNKLTSSDIQPGPFSEDELRERWNKQADKFNQWDSLDSHKQLAWAQTCAIEADRARAKLPIEREAKVQTITVQTPSFEELRDWILREGQFSPCGTELLQCLMLMTPAPAKSVYSPSIEELGPLIAWLSEEACQASNSGASYSAGMLCWAAQVVAERVDEDAPDPPAERAYHSICNALKLLLLDIQALIINSQGVHGLHRNGDLAPWSELLEGGEFSSWLGDAMVEAQAALAMVEPVPPTPPIAEDSQP